jgi:protein-S-isoprenylcysteine O-methyltransferase Ste14
MKSTKETDATRRGKPAPPEDTTLSGAAVVNLLKSVVQSVGVVLVGFGVAYLGTRLDLLFRWPTFHSTTATVAGWLLVDAGFLLRVWATYDFYERKMKVIKLSPQRKLVTTGAYRFSRNPLYLGANVFVFFGAGLLVGAPGALLVTAAHLPLVDLFIRREERQLEKTFGEDYLEYKKGVRRWI